MAFSWLDSPVGELESVDSLEVAYVVGYEGQVVGKGARCDYQVKVVKPRSPCFQLRFKHPEYFNRFHADGEHAEGLFKSFYFCQIGGGSLSVIYTRHSTVP